ncbi:MAG: Spy/CpxP family protein refolding chaperone [Candidatus Sericytochromatia bacterium]|nr:Spy/CpxP family protein refolding chaperone [Candidatus Sericytochromatia bacterium]
MTTRLCKAIGLALTLSVLPGCGSTALFDASTLGLDAVLQVRRATVSTDAAQVVGQEFAGDRMLKGAPGEAAKNGMRGAGPRGAKGPGGRDGFAREGHGPEGPRGGEHGPKGFFPGFEAMNLTESQQAQLKAIAESERAAHPTPDPAKRPEHPGQQVQALLTAQTLDVEALKAALNQAPPAPPDHADQHEKTLTAVRAVLTAEQINTLVARLEAAPPQGDRPAPPQGKAPERPDPAQRVDALAQTLNLNAEQKAALLAFETAKAAAHPAPDFDKRKADHEAHRAALITFWKTGDASGLAAARPAPRTPPAFPVDALVKLATSLSAEQRGQLFAAPAMGPGGPKMPGMRGPGGPKPHGMKMPGGPDVMGPAGMKAHGKGGARGPHHDGRRMPPAAPAESTATQG